MALAIRRPWARPTKEVIVPGARTVAGLSGAQRRCRHSGHGHAVINVGDHDGTGTDQRTLADRDVRDDSSTQTDLGLRTDSDATRKNHPRGDHGPLADPAVMLDIRTRVHQHPRLEGSARADVCEGKNLTAVAQMSGIGNVGRLVNQRRKVDPRGAHRFDDRETAPRGAESEHNLIETQTFQILETTDHSGGQNRTVSILRVVVEQPDGVQPEQFDQNTSMPIGP
jgi:hypothetical protein